MNLVKADAMFDPSKATSNAQDVELGQAVFDLVQAIRQELAADDDSPGELTPQEIIALAFQKVPATALKIVKAVRDGFTVLDAEALVHVLFTQLVSDEDLT